MYGNEEVKLKLTLQQGQRMRRLGENIWREEHLEISEIARRLLLEYMLWAESERGLAGKGHWADAS